MSTRFIIQSSCVMLMPARELHCSFYITHGRLMGNSHDPQNQRITPIHSLRIYNIEYENYDRSSATTRTVSSWPGSGIIGSLHTQQRGANFLEHGSINSNSYS